MGNWGDESDPEVAELKEYKVRYTVNFKKIFVDVGEMSEHVLEVTDKHPKDDLMKLWAGAMTAYFVFFLLSYKILMIITLPFIVFYFIALVRIGSVWKSFKYKAWQYWLMTIGALIVIFVVAMVAQHFGMMLFM
jgi:hypothetical protein